MKSLKHKLIGLMAAVALALGVAPMAFAAVPEATDYDGDVVMFFKDDRTTEFSMWTRGSASADSWENGKVKSYIDSSNKTVYAGFLFNADREEYSTYSDSQKAEVKALDNWFAVGSDGAPAFELDDSYCGKIWPIVIVKADDRTGFTTSYQTYLGIPAKEKLLADGTYSVDLTNSWSMFKVSGHEDATLNPTVVVNGENAWLVVNYRSSKGSAWRYGQLAWGDYATVSASDANGVGGAPAFVDGKTAADGMSDSTVYSMTFALPISTADLVDAVDNATALPYTARYVHKYSTAYDNAWYEYSKGSTFQLANLQKTSSATDVPADYAAVLDAIAKVPTDLSIYTDDSVAALNEALAAVTGAPKTVQADADALAKAIEDAIAELEEPAAAPAKVTAAREIPVSVGSTGAQFDIEATAAGKVKFAVGENGSVGSMTKSVAAGSNTINVAVAPKNLPDALTITFIADDGTETDITGDYTTVMAAVKAQGTEYGAAMSDYGYTARDYLVTKSASTDFRDSLADVSVPSGVAKTTVGSVEGLTDTGYALVHNSKLYYKQYFKITGDAADYTVTVNGAPATLVASGSEYYVKVPAVVSSAWNTSQTVVVTKAGDGIGDEGETYTVAFSAVDYAMAKASASKATLANIAKAMYNYHQAATADADEGDDRA